MIKQVMQYSWMFVLSFLLIGLTACEKESIVNEADVEDYTEQSVDELEERSGCGRRGCFEFVFPLTLVFPDGTETEVANYAELRTTIRSWKAGNPDAEDRPSLGFPLEIMTKNGEIHSVADRAQLTQLRKRCRRAVWRHRLAHIGRHCFRPAFPLTVVFPDETTFTAENPHQLKHAIRDWRQANPDAEGHATLSFPLTVRMEDGTEVTVADREELQALKESCQD